VIVLVGGGAGYWFLGRADSSPAEATVATVATGTFQQTVTGSGTIAPAKQADLDFAVSGRITAVDVEAGDTVDKGEVLATLDTVSLDAALASAKAQQEAAETTVANDADESSTQRAANDASLASARADVVQAEEDLEAATLRAPFTGTVASVTIATGDQAGSSSTGQAQGATDTGTGTGAATSTTAAITLVKPSRFVVDVDVAAADITDVKDGLQVEITPADATEAIFGTVQDVGRVAETGTSGTATFPVTVSVTGKQDGLYAGTTADVSIIVKQVDDVLTVPSQALTTSDGTTYVTVVDGSSTKKTAVTVGQTYGMSTEITKGISAGDKVQVASVGRVRTGGSSSGGGGGEMPAGGFPGGGMAPGGAGGGFPGGGPQ
jgi:macrolide-specific efflux system membrane fusion protein